MVRAAVEDGYRAELKRAVVEWEFDGKTFDHMLFEGSMPLGAELIPVGGNHRMLPHDLDLSVVLTYDLYSEDGTYKYPDKQIKTNTLKVTWIPGHTYTYSIVLSANEAIIGYAYP